MKYALSICILICLFATANAQYQYASLSDDFMSKKNYLKSPIVKEVSPPLAPPPKFAGRGQKILGISLTFGGIAFMVVGGLEIAVAQIADSNSLTTDEKNVIMAEGIVFAVVGVAATTTGIIFWKKGNQNSGGRGRRGSIMRSPSYQQNLSMDLKGAGAGLRFRF